MHLTFRNVNDAFYGLVHDIHSGYILTRVRPSRAGEVMMVEEPVTVTYTHPCERVLFNAARDANPFFHLYEALWMLAGRNDLAPLVYYNSQYKLYSDDGETVNGAYGYRWRHASRLRSRLMGDSGAFGQDLAERGMEATEVDQLSLIIDHLKSDPESRRAVLQMWNVEDDLLKVDVSKDVCCNTCVYFAIEWCHECDGKRYEQPDSSWREGDRIYPCRTCGGCAGTLNMTVCNRSNDLIWGLLGANAVHFSFLQEYVAAHLGLKVGKYHQITNNLHVYKERWRPDEWLHDYVVSEYPASFPLVNDPAVFDCDLPLFAGMYHSMLMESCASRTDWREPFIVHVARPMLKAFRSYKRGDFKEALNTAGLIRSDDWRRVAEEWIGRRLAKRTKDDEIRRQYDPDLAV